MNYSFIVGGGVALGLLIGAIKLGASLFVFIDPVSSALVTFWLIAYLLQAHGSQGLAIVWRATKGWMSGTVQDWDLADIEYATTVSKSASQAVILVGWVATLIGAVQILQHPGEASYRILAPAVAVMVLTLFYALIWRVTYWLPLASWLTDQAALSRRQAA